MHRFTHSVHVFTARLVFVSAISLLYAMAHAYPDVSISVSVLSLHFATFVSHSPPCLSMNGDQKRNFLCIILQGSGGRGGGERRDAQLQGKVSQKVFNIRYKSTLIFNEHTRS